MSLPTSRLHWIPAAAAFGTALGSVALIAAAYWSLAPVGGLLLGIVMLAGSSLVFLLPGLTWAAPGMALRRRRAWLLLAAILGFHLSTTMFLQPMAQLRVDRVALSGLGSDDVIKNWDPRALTMLDMLQRGLGDEGVRMQAMRRSITLALVALALAVPILGLASPRAWWIATLVTLLPQGISRLLLGSPWQPALLAIGVGACYLLRERRAASPGELDRDFIPRASSSPALAASWLAGAAILAGAAAFWLVAGSWIVRTSTTRTPVQEGERLAGRVELALGGDLVLGEAGAPPTVLVTWNKGCKYSQDQLHHVDALRRRMPAGVRFVAVNIAGLQDVLTSDFARSRSSLILAADPGGNLPVALATPATYLLDENSVVRYFATGSLGVADLEDAMARIGVDTGARAE